MKSLALISFLAASLSLTAAGPTGEWDLKSLPHYEPRQKVGGVIRMGGVSMSNMVLAWQDAFMRIHPDIRFANHLLSSDIALAAMIMGTADIAACGREADLVEILGFTESYLYDITPIVVGSGAWTSREGQNAIMRDGKFLSLPAAVVREQLKKLE